MREQAQKAALRAGPRLFKVFIIYTLILAVLNFVCYLLQKPAAEWQMNCYQYFSAGDYSLPDVPGRALVGSLLALVILLLSKVLTAGWFGLTLNAARGITYSWHDLSGAFLYFWKVLVITVFRSLACTFGLFLLVFPGVMMFYNWRLSYYVLAEHPEYGPIQCMKQSRRLMTGERKNLFKLDLSCWLLYGLAALIFYVTSGILHIWHMPSLMLLYAVFYNKMVYWKAPEDHDDTPPQEGSDV